MDELYFEELKEEVLEVIVFSKNEWDLYNAVNITLYKIYLEFKKEGVELKKFSTRINGRDIRIELFEEELQ